MVERRCGQAAAGGRWGSHLRHACTHTRTHSLTANLTLAQSLWLHSTVGSSSQGSLQVMALGLHSLSWRASCSVPRQLTEGGLSGAGAGDTGVLPAGRPLGRGSAGPKSGSTLRLQEAVS